MPDYNNTFEQEIDFEGIELTEADIQERVDRALEERERQEKERIFAEIERKRREEEDKYIAALDPQNGLNKLPVYRRNKADAIQYTEKEFYYALSNSPELTEQINKLKQVETYPDGTALSAEDSAQMKKIIGHLETLRDDWKNYTSSYLKLKTSEKRHAEENMRAASFKKSLGLVEQEMTDFSLSEASDAPAFTAIHSYISSLKSHYDEMMNGSLEIPKDAMEIIAKNPESALDEHEKKQLEWVDRSDEPLFPHEPSAADVFQGGVGDCYFLAGISAVVTHNPQAIRDMIRDNNDGTVTVRLYRHNRPGEDINDPVPYYITVDKSTPNLVQTGGDAYAKNVLWVQLIEKAYAASGFHKDGDTTYDGIRRGDSRRGVETILGFQNIDEEDIVALNADDKFDRIKKELEKGHFVHAGTDKKKPKKEFINRYNDLEKEYDNEQKALKKKLNLKSILEVPSVPQIHRFNLAKSYNGMFMEKDSHLEYAAHAYAVVGAEIVNDKKFIIVKEPNSMYDLDTNGDISLSMEEDVGKFKESDETTGYLAIPYDEFNDMFSEVKVITPIAPRPFDNPTTEIKELANQVLEGLEASKSLRAKMSMRYASPDFQEFYRASKELVDMTKEKFPSKAAVEKSIATLEKAAKTYLDARKTNEMSDSDRNLRVNMAKAAMNLQSIYECRKTPECGKKIRETQEDMLTNRIAYVANRSRKKTDRLLTGENVKTDRRLMDVISQMNTNELFDLAAKESPGKLQKLIVAKAQKMKEIQKNAKPMEKSKEVPKASSPVL